MKKMLSLVALFSLVCVALLTGCKKEETTTSTMPDATATNAPAAPATNAPAAPAQ